MFDVEKRTVEELIARYEFEPGLRDIYVEGEFDSDLLTASQAKNANEQYIYSIGTVDIPAALLQSYSLTSGNKQRVLALAKELNRNLEGNFQYLCLTDRDLDFWFQGLEDIRNHKWTEFSSIELHFFNPDFLRHYLFTVCRTKISCFESFLSSFTGILSMAFALRCVDRELGLNLSWLALEKCLHKCTNQVIRFDLEDYISRTLNKNGMHSELDRFNKSYKIWITKLVGDPRQHIRGHDFVHLLSWTVKTFSGVKDVSTETAVYRMFINSALNDTNISAEIAA
ncbi:hypothetical protein RJ41_11020 [Alteromonas marina]|uniref:DUF4435 domain-containing protein n=1 Tax=Alteromonas marina TaxID=203795 RepID=A0A0B3Y6D0_9ALTE|nr:hypothetical protein [Alteromonas marina]KHT52487.1 hypothetical protein RJ41_11020 [Alteromonas marina]